VHLERRCFVVSCPACLALRAPPPPRPQVLNAKPENVERESEIVAQSGRRGAVTISTNMAGKAQQQQQQQQH
jgi:hypothetical protein